MNFRIIIFVICSLLLSSCSETNPKEEPKKEDDSKASKVTMRAPIVDSENDGEVFSDLQDKSDFTIHPMDYVIGSKDAKVTLMEYSSPTCPHCSYFHKEVLPKLKEKFIDTGKVKYVLREFVANKQDLDSAIMGRCYKNEEDPIKLLNLLYIQQDAWAFNKNYREIIINMGGLAGVSRGQYMECLANKEIIDFLLEQAKNIATYPNFIGTPAFFIDGVMHKGMYSLDGLSKALDDKIRLVESEKDKEDKSE